MNLQGKLITAIAMALALAARSTAWAAAFSVSPLPMTLSPSQMSDLLKVTNDGDSEASFQIRTFAWSQTPDGTIDLKPSSEIVAFPEIFTIGPSETRPIRIGVLRPPGTTEKTYRVLVQELPPPHLPGRTIQLLPQLDMPVYVTPPTAEGVPEIAMPAVAGGMLLFAVADTGTAHIKITRLSITGHGDGQTIFTVSSAPTYVLAGGRRDYAVQIGASDCAKTRTISIAATLSDPDRTVTQEVMIPPDGCSGQAGLTGFELDTRQKVTIVTETARSSQ